MNINKLASEIYSMCHDYRNCDGRIKVSKNDMKGFDVYHSFGSDVAAYLGDSAQKAFDRVIFSIDLREIDWHKPLKGYIVQELRRIREEEEVDEEGGEEVIGTPD